MQDVLVVSVQEVLTYIYILLVLYKLGQDIQHYSRKDPLLWIRAIRKFCNTDFRPNARLCREINHK